MQQMTKVFGGIFVHLWEIFKKLTRHDFKSLLSSLNFNLSSSLPLSPFLPLPHLSLLPLLPPSPSPLSLTVAQIQIPAQGSPLLPTGVLEPVSCVSGDASISGSRRSIIFLHHGQWN